MTEPVDLYLVTPAGTDRLVGEIMVEIFQPRRNGMIAGALVLAEPVEETFEMLAGLINVAPGRRWKVDPHGLPYAFRGTFIVDSLLRAGDTRVCALDLAGDGSEIIVEDAK